MKKLILFYILLFQILVFAQVPDNPQLLDSVEDSSPRAPSSKISTEEKVDLSDKKVTSETKKPVQHKATPKAKAVDTEIGNLPSYSIRKGELAKAQNGIILPQSKNLTEVLESLHIGDILKCRISQSFKAYENSQIPLRAIITEGKFKGGLLIGMASMDAKTKVIRINFTEIRTSNNDLYSFTGGVFAKSGAELEGEYETHYWRYFWSEALLSATSGYAQGTIERSKNAFGQYETENTPENAAKIGVANGVSTTVKELSDRAKSAPEFTKIEGPIFVEVMVLKEAHKI